MRRADDTMATDPGGPQDSGTSFALGETLAGDPSATPPGPHAPHAIVQAGRTGDDLGLSAGDPQRYVDRQEIARGGMGRILAARDRRLGRPVAIKELLIGSSELRARFDREARITAKLQHPAIVSLLEAGSWPGGDPFYVMRLVAGESLDKVIARCPTLASRLALLPTVIAAVDALAYAHSKRVIHRDLKPANVLVGEFGETVVIDWGLAKDLATGATEPDVSVGPYRATAEAALGQTEAGAVMGTPAYMPIEQALGHAVDERADVYALGAMLYHVLAGAPPYAGTTADAILDAVSDGPPPPIDARTDGVPADLVTIVAKAMARAVDDRYPTAKQLADDLKKFQTGQLVGAHHYSSWQLVRRWARRHRTAIAVAVVGVALLGMLGIVSVRRILREEAHADQNRLDAEELMSFMLRDLRDKLEPLGRLDLLDQVANKAIVYYDRWGASGSAAELRTRALARTHLGEVLAAQGHADQALAEYRAAQAIVTALVASDPTDAALQRDLATDHRHVGAVLRAQGDLAGALAAYRASLTMLEALAPNHPTSTLVQQHLSVSQDNIGDLLRAQGDAAGALAAYQASMAIATRLLANAPANADLQRDVAISHNKIGDALIARGDTAGGLVSYRAAMAIAKTLAANDPTNADRQRELSVSHARVGYALRVQGDTAGALPAYRTSLAILDTLAANDPTSADRQRDLEVAHDNLGEVLDEQGDTAGALAAYRASMAIAKTLAANDPTNTERQRDLSFSHDNVGDALSEHGDLVSAVVEYRASLAIRETLAANTPTSVDRQRELEASHQRIGRAALAQGDAPGALAAYRAAIAIARTLAANNPASADLQRDLASSHEGLGDVLRARGDAAGALAAYRAALAIGRTLAANDPTNAAAQQHLSLAQDKVGNVLLAQGDNPGALAEYQASMAIAKTLAANDPTNADRQRDLSISHGKIGDVLRANGDAAGALAAYRARLAIATTLATHDPSNAQLQHDLAMCDESVGDALLALRDGMGALEAYSAGLALAKRLQAKSPTNADLRELVAHLTTKVATCCRTRGTTREPVDDLGPATRLQGSGSVVEVAARSNKDREGSR